MAADLVDRKVSLIFATGGAAALWGSAPRQLGRLRRGRSCESASGALARCYLALRTIRKCEPGLTHFELTRLGWADGRNVRIEQRWTNNDTDRTPLFAKELVELQPDAILTINSPDTAAMQQETRTIPIVFAVVNDPVRPGLRRRSAAAGRQHYRFHPYRGGDRGQMAPDAQGDRALCQAGRSHVNAASERYYIDPFEAAARALAVEAIIAPVRNDAEIKSTINSLGRGRGWGSSCCRTPHGCPPRNRHLGRNSQQGSDDLGLLSYGPHYEDMFRDAAGYVDRILKGEKPTDLPVQVPTRFDLVIN